MRTRGIFSLVAVAMVTLFTAGSGALAQSSVPDVPNLNKSLKGTFTYLSHGDGEYYPTTGILSFDGNGNITGTMELNDDGTVCSGITLSGTYTVNADKTTGTGSLTLATSTSGCGNTDTIPMSFALSSGGKTVYIEEMDTCATGTFCDSFAIFEAAATRR
ncbi:MAG TPA: hypothetical protein VNF27_15340 [Candidatus Binataceae bacterium]|nr:hypothetical protein [Candidatus Binataceae bacterium]